MKALYEKICELVASGQLTQIKLLRITEDESSAVKKIKKKLSAYEEWIVSGKKVTYKGEPVSPVFAVWKGCIAVQSGDRLSRFHILYVFFGDHRYDFAIPGDLSEIKKLPDLQFSGAEVELLVKIANTISGQKKAKTVTIKDNYPARDTVYANTLASARLLSADEQTRLFKLLTSSTLLNFIALAAIDIQLRGVKLFRSCPHLLYSIYANAEERTKFDEGNEWSSILSAVTVSNERGHFGYSPIRLRLDAKSGWDNYPDVFGRLFLVSYRERANLNLILDDYRTAVKNAQSGDLNAVPRYSPTLLCGPSILTDPFVAQFQDGLSMPNKIDKEDLRLLRTAVSRVINEDAARALRKSWQEKMRNPNNVLESGRILWQLSLSEVVAAAWFRDAFLQEAFLEIYSRAVKRQEIETVNSEKILRESFQRLANVKGYESCILNAEGLDKKAVDDALSGSHIAFTKTPARDVDAGKVLLCFTETSLLRFLQKTSMTKKLLAAFIDYCDERGVRRKNNKIKFKVNQSGRYKVFFLEELEKYRSEDSK